MVFPAKHQSDTYYTHDPNAVWLAAEGLILAAGFFQEAGYTLTQIVGGVEYKVHSPKSQHASTEGLNSGKKLFAKYIGDLQRSPHALHHTQQVMALQKNLLKSLC